MRILIAPDKFKGSLGAIAVVENIAAGLRTVLSEAELLCRPLADGGEGTAAVIGAVAGGSWQTCLAHDSLGEPIQARYVTIADGRTAVMDMSEASGLWRIPKELRNPELAFTFGTGEMVLHAVGRDVDEIIVGLGGSATNDGGVGCARALGFSFRDAHDNELPAGVSELARLDRIVRPPTRSMPRIIAATDVCNPLLGANGATRIFSPQKGADRQQIEHLERALGRLAEVVARDLGCDFRDTPGAGAAGGLGFGLMSFFGAAVRPGFDVVAECVDLQLAIDAADVVITGEGRLDAQTLAGKVPAGVARLARAAGKKVYAIVGECEKNCAELFDRVVTLVNAEATPHEAMRDAPHYLRARARELAQLFR